MNLKLKYLNGLIFAGVIVQQILYILSYLMWFDVVAEVVHPLAGIVVNWLFLILLKLSFLVCGCFPLVGNVADILFLGFLFCSLFIIVDVVLLLPLLSW